MGLQPHEEGSQNQGSLSPGPSFFARVNPEPCPGNRPALATQLNQSSATESQAARNAALLLGILHWLGLLLRLWVVAPLGPRGHRAVTRGNGFDAY